MIGAVNLPIKCIEIPTTEFSGKNAQPTWSKIIATIAMYFKVLALSPRRSVIEILLKSFQTLSCIVEKSSRKNNILCASA